MATFSFEPAVKSPSKRFLSPVCPFKNTLSKQLTPESVKKEPIDSIFLENLLYLTYMIRFQIPKSYISGFETLASLQSESIDQLIQFLNKVPVGTGPQTFGQIFEATFNFQEPFSRHLAITLYSLGSFNLNQAQKLNEEELAISLTESVKVQTGTKFGNDSLRILSDNLLRLIKANKSLALTFKAFSLMSENESVIKSNHVITDIRLLFDEELKNPNRHGLLIHQLRLVADENNDQTEYYFNLTASELQKLQDQITRALEKERLIREDYNQNISFINITE